MTGPAAREHPLLAVLGVFLVSLATGTVAGLLGGAGLVRAVYALLHHAVT